VVVQTSERAEYPDRNGAFVLEETYDRLVAGAAIAIFKTERLQAGERVASKMDLKLSSVEIVATPPCGRSLREEFPASRR
jgi:hypothetical protein